jgi:hypothetical protein
VNPTSFQQPYPPPAAYPVYPPFNPIAGPAKVFGILFAVLAALSLLGVIAMAALSGVLIQRPSHPTGTAAFPASFFFIAIAAVALAIAALHAATAFGLLARKPWGRTLVIITAALSLISIPIGTVLGGFALYFFVREGAEQDYARLSLGQP